MKVDPFYDKCVKELIKYLKELKNIKKKEVIALSILQKIDNKKSKIVKEIEDKAKKYTEIKTLQEADKEKNLFRKLSNQIDRELKVYNTLEKGLKDYRGKLEIFFSQFDKNMHLLHYLGFVDFVERPKPYEVKLYMSVLRLKKEIIDVFIAKYLELLTHSRDFIITQLDIIDNLRIVKGFFNRLFTKDKRKKEAFYRELNSFREAYTSHHIFLKKELTAMPSILKEVRIQSVNVINELKIMKFPDSKSAKEYQRKAEESFMDIQSELGSMYSHFSSTEHRYKPFFGKTIKLWSSKINLTKFFSK